MNLKKYNFKKAVFFLIVLNIILLISSIIIIHKTFRKTEYSISNSELIGKISRHDTVIDCINDSSGFKAGIKIIDGGYYMTYEGNELFRLEDFLKKKLPPEFNNNSYKSSFYSLAFLRNYIIGNGLDGLDINLIDNVIDKVINISEAPFNTDVFINSDHPVPERLETLLLYNSYKLTNGNQIKDYHIKHIKHLIYLLTQKGFFSYNMNHGLMQIRSLIRTGLILQKQDLIEISENFINAIKPIYFSSDGAIMESAFGYQFYIYKQFYLFDKYLQSVGNTSLEKDVGNQKRYMESITANNFFLQGTGDSYSMYLDSNYVNCTDSESYQIYKFGNRVSGIKSTKSNFVLHFISMDNKPNVHKLPEDLAVYVFCDMPLFYNTGTYSYEKNDTIRQRFLNINHQNGLKFSNEQNNFNYSDITELKIDTNFISLKGIARNENDCDLQRQVIFYPSKGEIMINDSSLNPIFSNYILNPVFDIRQVDDFEIQLLLDTITYTISSTKKININKTIVSNGYRQYLETNQIVVEGNNRTLIKLNQRIPIDFNAYTKNISDSQRQITTKDLKNKYWLSLVITKIVKAYSATIILFILFLFIMRLSINNKHVILLSCFLITTFLTINILYDGELIVYIFYRIVDIAKLLI